MEKQHTIHREVTLKGVGLHTAHNVSVTFKPAAADSGVVFSRPDLPNTPSFRISIDKVMSQTKSRRTSLSGGVFEVQTVEHLLAVLSGTGIDNMLIEVTGDELPGLDGSSLKFLEEIRRAGIREQESDRQYFSLKEPVSVEEEGGASIIALPAPDFKISYTLHFDHPFLKTQFKELTINPEIFEKELAPARTFCLEEDVALQRQGFGHGATYDNTLVVGKTGVVNNTVRFPDEFVRHKIVDLLGDLFLIGQPVKCRIIAVRSGHSLNLKLARRISQQRQRSIMAGIGTQHSVGGARELDCIEIMKILPHREPFLFIDRITHLEKGTRAVGIKNVTINDYFFRGHFPGKPVMPGVLIMEALAQVAGVMMLACDENRGKLAYFMTIDNVKFRKLVVPGDQVLLEVEAGKIKSRTGKVHGKAYVDGRVVAEGDLMFALADSA